MAQRSQECGLWGYLKGPQGSWDFYSAVFLEQLVVPVQHRTECATCGSKEIGIDPRSSIEETQYENRYSVKVGEEDHARGWM